MLDRKHEVQSYYAYDGFGNVRESRGKSGNRILYTGQQYDGVTEQYYLRARYYNPMIGRFIQEDVYRGDGLNLYAYCGNNPVVYYDPSGYDSCGGDVTFYSVQNEEDAKRLLAGGAPWPTKDTRAHLGPGFYSWEKLEDAINYKNLKEMRIEGEKFVIVVATITGNNLKEIKMFNLGNFTDNQRTEWMGKYSSLYGEGLDHGYNYIKNKTDRGVENYFTVSVFNKFKLEIRED